ncbi:hypothetical protein [Halobacterium sp. R2-5]|uniref:DUF7504 family protein n=1 Tax=Halobacterium sp. R2-5 TaxID=2715751 RepID=UPI0014208BA6|nr:hypothetical protein [Halobacterium sp. R2-5]NIB98370.1 hypothetical protein [Halobacterium sp. R2-5]
MRREGGHGDTDHVLVTGTAVTPADAAVEPASNVLGVAYDTTAEAWLAGVQPGPDRVAVVSVGEHSRTAAEAASPNADPDAVATMAGAVETVPDVGDAAAVGTLVNNYLSVWDGETTVYVDDVSPLLECVSAEAAFRFLHALQSCAAANDARLVAGLDTAGHPPHVAATFGELFGDVREV